MKTLQETFDFIVNHLAQQKTPARSVEGCCKYLIEETGKKCAVGCLLSAEMAKECDAWPGDTSIAEVWDRAKDELEVSGLGRRESIDFYGAMQNAHDITDGVEELKRRLRKVADSYSLNADSVNNITEWK